MKRKSIFSIVAVTAVCCAAMALVDGVWRPGYALKSAIKLTLFFLLPLLLSLFNKDVLYLKLFRFQKKGILSALGLGIGVYTLILGAYFLISPFFDFSPIAGKLTENAGVSADNFLFVALYISFVNSLLEEFFFRGFVFSNLKRLSSRSLAYWFSSVIFAVYHVAMMTDWFSPALFVLVMAGLTVGGLLFNYLNERLNCVYVSWLVHMFANFSINTIGFLLLT